MTDEGIANAGTHKLREKASDEFKRFITIFLYLWVVFALLSVHRSFVLLQHHLDYQEHTFAFVNALVFAKVLLIAEHFHLGTRFADKPLICPILHKSLVFTAISIGFHIIEIALVGLWHGKTITDSLAVTGFGNTLGIVSWGIMSFIVLLPFFGFRELGRVIGRRELWNLIFKCRTTDPHLANSDA